MCLSCLPMHASGWFMLVVSACDLLVHASGQLHVAHASTFSGKGNTACEKGKAHKSPSRGRVRSVTLYNRCKEKS